MHITSLATTVVLNYYMASGNILVCIIKKNKVQMHVCHEFTSCCSVIHNHTDINRCFYMAKPSNNILTHEHVSLHTETNTYISCKRQQKLCILFACKQFSSLTFIAPTFTFPFQQKHPTARARK